MRQSAGFVFLFFFNDTATTEIYTLSLHDALPISAPWISSPEMAMRDPGQGGRHRQTWRWSTPARIVGCGDASSRSVATAGDLVPSSAMAMLQLDVRGLVVSASSDAAMLERGEKKPPRGVRGGKSACGSGRKKPRRRSGRKTARPDVQLG